VVLVVGGWVVAAGSVGCGSGESCELGEVVQDSGGPWPVRVEVDDPAGCGVDVAGGGGEEFQPQGLMGCATRQVPGRASCWDQVVRSMASRTTWI